MEINSDYEPKQDISMTKFFVKLCIGMVIYAPIAKGMNDKCKTFVSVIESTSSGCIKFVFLSLLWLQLIQCALVLTVVFKLVSSSETNMDLLGDAFGVVILNDFDDYAAVFYRMYLEPFQNELINEDDFMKVEITVVSSISCFFVIFLISI